MRTIITLLLFISTLNILKAETVAVEPTDTDGNGYRNISTLAHLRWLSETELAWSENYELDNDIDANETKEWNFGDHDDNPATPDSAMGWRPIAEFNINFDKPFFTGKFKGNMHSIDGIYINRRSAWHISVGFFGCVSDGAEISDLRLTRTYVAGNYLVANFVSVLYRYDSTKTVRIENCRSEGAVAYSGMYRAGFCAYNLNAEISRSSCDAYLLNPKGDVAGLFCADNEGVIENCYSEGKISGARYTGGITGKNWGRVENCYTKSQHGINGWKSENSFVNSCYSNYDPYKKKKEGYTNWDFESIWNLNYDKNQGYPTLRGHFVSKYEIKDYNRNGFYEIYTLKDLKWVSEHPEIWGDNLELMNDINAVETKYWNLTDHDNDPMTEKIALGFNPIGDFDLSQPEIGFRGEFNGNNHEISNLYINRADKDFVGFFASLNSNASVYDLELEKVNITARNYVAGMSALVTADGIANKISIKNCKVSGVINANNFVGGLLGQISAEADSEGFKILKCSTEVQINAKQYLGGFAYEILNRSTSKYSIIDSCESIISYTQGSEIGGFCVNNFGEKSIIRNSKVSGAINGQEEIAGFCINNSGTLDLNSAVIDLNAKNDIAGFCLRNLANVENSKAVIRRCLVSGRIRTEDKAAAFCMDNIASKEGAEAVIENSFADCYIECDKDVSGFIYSNKNTHTNGSAIIDKCYTKSILSAITKLYGFCIDYNPSSNSKIIDSYWDKEYSQAGTSNGGEERNHEEMQNVNNYATWDFNSIWEIHPDLNYGYPYLKNTIEYTTAPLDIDYNGYRNITKLAHLKWLNSNKDSWSGNYELDNDIDASETKNWFVGDHDNDSNTPDSAMGWLPNMIFYGKFDGKGHSIDNIYINRPKESNCGFFNSIKTGAEINNLDVLDAIIISGDESGIFAGEIYSNTEGVSIISCNSSGVIKTETSFIGGFVGKVQAYGDLKIQNCTSKANIEAYQGIGAFCGTISLSYNADLKILNCEGEGEINSVQSSGGFIGSITLSQSSIAEISKCKSNTNIICSSKTGRPSGGFIARVHTFDGELKISSCYSEGDIFASTEAAGFLGHYFGKAKCEIKNSYTRVNVNADESAVGFIEIASDSVSIENCYSSGEIYSEFEEYGFAKSKFGKQGSISSCYWDKDVSGVDSSEFNAVPLTSSGMKDFTNFINWNFDTIWDIDPAINDGYPYLRGLAPIGIIDNYTDNSESRISIYPNPATEFLNLSFTDNYSAAVRVSIIDMNGREYKLFNGGAQIDMRLDISCFPSGRYYLKVEQGTMHEILPLVIKY